MRITTYRCVLRSIDLGAILFSAKYAEESAVAISLPPKKQIFSIDRILTKN
jgi:hypothetical protein